MELLQLAHFRAVARLEHMTRAAEELNVTQPSLSRSIIRLEQELGVPLFDRRGRGLGLNDFGRAFLTHVDRIFRELDTATGRLRDMAGLDQGNVSLAAGALHSLPEVLRPFQETHPKIRFRLFAHPLPELHRLLATGESDLCIVPADPVIPGVHWQPLQTGEIFLVVPSGHRLAGRVSVALVEVADEDMVLGKRGDSLRDVMEEYFHLAGIVPRVTCETDEPTVIEDFVAAGLGVAFIPNLPTLRLRDGSTSWVRISEPACRFSLGIAWNESRYLSQAARAFREHIIAHFAASPPTT